MWSRLNMAASRLRVGSSTAFSVAATGSALAAVASLQQPACCWFSSSEGYHLRYFDARGVAETARLVMVLGGASFTDERWPLDFSKAREDMSPGMVSARSQGLLSANLDRAPVLVVDGKYEIGQSKSIERFLARRLGLLGDNEIEAAQIDSFTEHLRDLKDKYKQAKATKRPDQLTSFFESTMPAFFQKMEQVCSGSGDGPVIGASLSLADASLFVFVTEFFDDKSAASRAIKGCPRLCASIAAVSAHPLVVKYLESRPVTAV